MVASSSEHSIVMLPFMAQGHLIPFLELAKQITNTTPFTITIVSTPTNISYLTTSIAKDSNKPPSSSQINLVSLPFNGPDHGLPPNVENAESISLDKIITLFHSSSSLEAPFRSFLTDTIHGGSPPPICIISDIFMGWANEVAKSLGIPNVGFATGGAYGTAAYISIWQNLPHRSLPPGEVSFNVPGFPDTCQFHVSHLHRFIREADGSDPWSRFFQPQIAFSLGCFGWLCNTVEEIEPLGLDILRKYTKLPVWCVGPLLPPEMLDRNGSIIGERTGREPGVSPEKCVEWLEMYPESSVLYISFGSQNSISPSQMMALAMGLEESERPFIWVSRPPFGFDLRGEFRDEWLPEGFEQRMTEKKQGLFVHKWALQLEILRHKSTGAFLSHCGWNSTLESLSQGVPLIGWPLAAEQAYNCKMLEEEMGVCVVLAKGHQSRLSKDEAKRVIDLVMEKGGKGEEMKTKAVRIGELIRGGHKGSSRRALDHFFSTLLENKKKQ